MFFKQKKTNITFVRLILIILFMGYLSYLAYLTFFSHFYGRTYIHRSINLFPLKTIVLFLSSSFDTKVIVTNILGNIAAFVPMGFLFPTVFPKPVELKKMAIFLLSATVIIEVTQYIAAVGTSDIDDVILNLVGGLIGYFLNRHVLKFILK